MRKHNGMRPQDIVVLLKMLTIRHGAWQFKDLANELFISSAEISESLNRSQIAGLVSSDKRTVHRNNFVELLHFGFPYVFPVHTGTMVTGMPTAHSHPFFKKEFTAGLDYVWLYAEGESRGMNIPLLYAGQLKAAIRDEKLHLYLACLDILRIGRAREIEKAREVLYQNILSEQTA